MKSEALVIVDMSNDFVHESGNLTAGKPAQEIVPYIIKKADEMLTNGGHIVFTMDAHEIDDAHFDKWPPHNIIGTWGQELYGELNSWFQKNKSNPNVIYTPKADYNAFYGTDLAATLKTKGVEKVHVTGVATDICVFLTTSGADSNGFETVIHRKGVATFTQNGEIFINQANALFHTEIID